MCCCLSGWTASLRCVVLAGSAIQASTSAKKLAIAMRVSARSIHSELRARLWSAASAAQYELLLLLLCNVHKDEVYAGLCDGSRRETRIAERRTVIARGEWCFGRRARL